MMVLAICDEDTTWASSLKKAIDKAINMVVFRNNTWIDQFYTVKLLCKTPWGEQNCAEVELFGVESSFLTMKKNLIYIPQIK